MNNKGILLFILFIITKKISYTFIILFSSDTYPMQSLGNNFTSLVPRHNTGFDNLDECPEKLAKSDRLANILARKYHQIMASFNTVVMVTAKSYMGWSCA